MFLTYFLTTIVSLVLLKYLKVERKKWLPGPLSLPFLGCALQIGLMNRKYKSFEVFEKFCKDYGSVVGLQIGLQYTVVVEDFETAKQILNSEDWQARNPEGSIFTTITFDKQVGLMFAYGDDWRRNRRFVLHTLKDVGFGKRNKLEVDLMDEIQHFMISFEAKRLASNGDLSMHRVFKLASLNLLFRILCAKRFSEDDDLLKYMIGRLEETAKSISIGCQIQYAFPFLAKIPGLTNQQYQIEGITILHNFFQEILVQRRKLGDYTTNPNDFIGYYLKKIDDCHTGSEQDSTFNDEQLIQSCSDMFLAGADTTGNLLEFSMLFMTKFPNVQKKVQVEIDAVVPHGQTPCFSDADKMPYTQAVLHECMRHATITPIIPRASITDTKINNCYIPKNTAALINAYKINHDVKVFGDPEVFRPERFLDEHGELHTDASSQFLQFGLGRRLCVGMPTARINFFTFFTNFFHRYTVEPSVLFPEIPLDFTTTGINNQPLPFHCKVKLRKEV